MTKKPQPYDRPPRLPEGDARPNEIYLCVGLALTTWERLEWRQARLFATVLGRRSEAAARAYGVIVPAASKRDMLHQAAKFVFIAQTDLREQIIRLSDVTVHYSALRNDIAHGIATNHTINDKDYGYYLMPGEHASKKFDSLLSLEMGSGPEGLFDSYSYAYTAKQIEDIAIKFDAHGAEISSLTARIWELRKDPAHRDLS